MLIDFNERCFITRTEHIPSKSLTKNENAMHSKPAMLNIKDKNNESGDAYGKMNSMTIDIKKEQLSVNIVISNRPTPSYDSTALHILGCFSMNTTGSRNLSNHERSNSKSRLMMYSSRHELSHLI